MADFEKRFAAVVAGAGKCVNDSEKGIRNAFKQDLKLNLSDTDWKRVESIFYVYTLSLRDSFLLSIQEILSLPDGARLEVEPLGDTKEERDSDMVVSRESTPDEIQSGKEKKRMNGIVSMEPQKSETASISDLKIGINASSSVSRQGLEPIPKSAKTKKKTARKSTRKLVRSKVKVKC